MKNILILIPSLDPDDKIISVVTDLKEIGFSNFLIIDDGSKSKEYFNKLHEDFACTVLTHDVNKGKGRALKTGFEHIKSMPDISYIITVDGDYQHKAPDVLAVANALQKSDNNTIILGARNFNKKANIPFRSWIGNQMSAAALGLMIGKKINDSQTGLRGFHFSSLVKMLNIDGERFEYETNVLLSAKKLHYKLQEVPIQTIYIEENETSHFQPIGDSLKVFSVMLKFVASSCISFIVDMSIFSGIVYFFFRGNDTVTNIFISSVIARLISSAVNFSLNYKTVFKSEENFKKAVLKYYGLAFVIMIISSFATGILTEWSHKPVVMKILVDGVLFILSYLIQKHFIFAKKG